MEKETLSAIAGYSEEKEEIRRYIDALKNYEKYQAKGAYIPKGLILSGRPGVGKTLFAKVISNEANVPTFHLTASMRSEKEVKEVFRKAQKNAPSILFIDELDKMLGMSDISPMMDEIHDSILLTTLMKELDDTEYKNVMVIASVNNYECLPPSLVRTGRMDKHITIPLPNEESRGKIFSYYLSQISDKDNGISVESLAKNSSGLTGSDIKTLLNDANMDSIAKNQPLSEKEILGKIPEYLFREMKRKNKKKDLDNLSYHELGHAITWYILTGKAPSVSLSSYHSTIGFTKPGYEEETMCRNKEWYLDRLAVNLGGIQAEQVFLHTIYDGGRGDIFSCSQLIDKMMNTGMYGMEYISRSRHPTEKFQQTVEEKTLEILQDAEKKACQILEDNRGLMEYLQPKLIEKTTLHADEFEQLVKEYEARTGMPILKKDCPEKKTIEIQKPMENKNVRITA